MADMTGRRDLGIRRLPQSGAIPVQSKGPTKTSNGMTNNKLMQSKMKKVMIKQGMIKDGVKKTVNLKPIIHVKGMPIPNVNHNTSTC